MSGDRRTARFILPRCAGRIDYNPPAPGSQDSPCPAMPAGSYKPMRFAPAGPAAFEALVSPAFREAQADSRPEAKGAGTRPAPVSTLLTALKAAFS